MHWGQIAGSLQPPIRGIPWLRSAAALQAHAKRIAAAAQSARSLQGTSPWILFPFHTSRLFEGDKYACFRRKNGKREELIAIGTVKGKPTMTIS